MDLSQLRFVAAVAETGSFSRSADYCYVTQPTLPHLADFALPLQQVSSTLR
ncbi:MAG: LysR family transcriptional regulator [Thermodesulfovibrionales bacterium]